MDLPQDPKWDMAKTGLAGLIGQKENCKGCSGIQLKSRRCEETNVAVRSPCRCGSVCAWDKVKEGVSLGGGSAEQCKVQGEWARASPEVAGTLSTYTVPYLSIFLLANLAYALVHCAESLDQKK